MKSIKTTINYTSVIKKSEFICTLIPCNNDNEINNIIQQYQTKYHDANHNCVAYIVNNNIKANDDGEPSGTAGMPMLNVLQKQGLSNIIAIVTRYFGGIKLGAGGLTRAYTQSVADALKQAIIVEKTLVAMYEIKVDYTYTKKFDHLLKTNKINCIEIKYNDQVNYTCYIPDSSFFEQIQELTNNNYTKEFIKDDYIELIQS